MLQDFNDYCYLIGMIINKRVGVLSRRKGLDRFSGARKSYREKAEGDGNGGSQRWGADRFRESGLYMALLDRLLV